MEFNDILQRMLERIPNRYDKRPGGVFYLLLAPVAWVLGQCFYVLNWAVSLLFPDTSEGEFLDLACSAFGVDREPATFAERRIICTDSSGEPMSVPLGARFGAAGMVYAIEEELEPGNYRAVAQTSGSAGNIQIGDLLPIDGISGLGRAELGEILVAARDEETDTELRERFAQSVRETPYGGNIADYRQKVLAIDGVGAVAVFGAPALGPGQVGLVIADEQGEPAAQELITRVEERIGVNGDGIAPIGHTVTVRTSTAKAVDIAAQLVLKSGASLEVVKPYAEKAIKGYIASIGFDEPTVFYARLVSAILTSHESILDVGTVTLGGGSANLALSKTFDSYQVAKTGTITVSEVV